MKSVSTFLIAATLSLGGLSTTFAQSLENEITAAKGQTETGQFIKRRYTVNGSWTISNADGRRTIHFSDDFKTKNGPDLKVFLTPKNFDTLDRKTAIQGALNIGVLKSNTGAQSYTIPDDVDLSDYKSVIVHCEAYSVLWGGFDIPE